MIFDRSSGNIISQHKVGNTGSSFKGILRYTVDDSPFFVYSAADDPFIRLLQLRGNSVQLTEFKNRNSMVTATAFDYWTNDAYYMAGISSKHNANSATSTEHMFIYMYDKADANFKTTFYEDPHLPTGRSIDTLSYETQSTLSGAGSSRNSDNTIKADGKIHLFHVRNKGLDSQIQCNQVIYGQVYISTYPSAKFRILDS